MTRNERILKEELTELSIATDWESVKKEWYLSKIEYDEDDDNDCLCSKKHIKELCYIKNSINDIEVIVGNECVKKFFGETIQTKVFLNIGKLIKNINNNISEELLENGYLDFLFNKTELSILLKKKLSIKQKIWKIKLHEKFLNNYLKNGYNKYIQIIKLLNNSVNVTDKDKNYLSSLFNHYKTKNFLSIKQENSIEQVYNKYY